jgi:hypothetical protein
MAIFCMVTARVSYAADPAPAAPTSAATIEDAFKNGKVKGEIGSYFEQIDSKQADKNRGWANAYLSLKYETQEWNRVKAGVGFFGHSQVYNDSKDGSDPFNVDVEKEYTVPELYLNLGFAEKSSVTVGRWEHKKVSHIDDVQSEGAYVNFQEIPNLELISGFMTRFAEIDYDDSEDFGRTTDAQDLNSNVTYGVDSEPYVLFLDPRYKINKDLLILNPFVYYQDGYAAVYGLDTKWKYKPDEKSKITYGNELNYYHVVSDKAGFGDADAWMVAPNIAVGPVTVRVGTVKLDGGNSFNRPDWFSEWSTGMDQTKVYGSNADLELYFTNIKYTKNKFWTSVAYGDYSYDTNSTQGNGTQEMEWLTGYNFTKSLSGEIRLFNVVYDDIVDRDYKAMETLVKYKF